ncbi:hypothetical protein chiPu_0029967 [Chiloscyllium punctatum]|uniref:Uncharacterized protein n=1 Tax=Chiloscyllium punctatum TaxID=137246 RepID=A0A401TU47_CHIPU|nr:hypothetical protein [Chiloscyllium punctatum]
MVARPGIPVLLLLLLRLRWSGAQPHRDSANNVFREAAAALRGMLPEPVREVTDPAHSPGFGAGAGSDRKGRGFRAGTRPDPGEGRGRDWAGRGLGGAGNGRGRDWAGRLGIG